MTMKRVTAVRNACLAAAGLVATAALAYGVAFVGWAPARPVRDYAAEIARITRPKEGTQPPYRRKDIESVWTWQPVIQIPPPRRPLEATLVGTTTSSNPANCYAVVNGPSGQSLLRTGDRFDGARLSGIGRGTATFTLGNSTEWLSIRRSEK